MLRPWIEGPGVVHVAQGVAFAYLRWNPPLCFAPLPLALDDWKRATHVVEKARLEPAVRRALHVHLPRWRWTRYFRDVAEPDLARQREVSAALDASDGPLEVEFRGRVFVRTTLPVVRVNIAPAVEARGWLPPITGVALPETMARELTLPATHVYVCPVQ